MIEAKNYPFLQDKNRFIACFKIYNIAPNRIIKTVDKLNSEDINKIVNKIRASKIFKKKEKEFIH
ncbi:MAG: hypothetical protein FWG20_06915 [Candidatus Cloacimonetes bacterium]|nr:hypothetical protein [Candidatus Cloacimonadota bacterium]